MPVFRSAPIIRELEKPILTYKDIPYPAALIFNAGVEKYNGRYVMLFRNDYGSFEERKLCGTNIGLAFSDDGVDWGVSDTVECLATADVNDLISLCLE